MNVNLIAEEPHGCGAPISDGPLSVHVTLSERNLRHLLDALEKFEANTPGLSPFLQRRCEDGSFLTVTAQTDSEHYERREPGPGFEGIV